MACRVHTCADGIFLLTDESYHYLKDFLDQSPENIPGTTLLELPSLLRVESRGKLGASDGKINLYIPSNKPITEDILIKYKIGNFLIKNIPMYVIYFEELIAATKQDIATIAGKIPYCDISYYESVKYVRRSLELDADEKQALSPFKFSGKFFKEGSPIQTNVHPLADKLSTLKL